MKITPIEYQHQIAKAQKTLQDLNKRLHKVKNSLQTDPNNTILLRQLDKISLDITITENELEHAQSCICQKN